METRFNNLILAALLVVALSAAALAQAPRLINYQGRVLNAVGAPVLDGAHNFDFEIYDMSAGGGVLWDELGVAINTTGGLFTYALSSSNAFPFDLFTTNLELWLEVTVDGQVQSPRTRLISNPYSETAGNLSYLNPFTGFLGWKTDAGANQFSTYGLDGLEQIRLWGANWGEIFLHDGDASNDRTVVLTANISGGGELDLRDDAGVSTINLHGGQTGNTSVEFPTDAIDAIEMYNEPGIAHTYESGAVSPLASADSLVDSIVVDVPTSGFLSVTASGIFQVNHTFGSGDQVPRASADDVKVLNFDNFTLFSVISGAPSGTYYSHFSINYVEAVSAGQTVIYLMADAFAGTNSEVLRTHLTAEFFPTSYGVVDDTKIATTEDNGIISRIGDGSDLIAPEIIDVAEKVRKEYEAELEALRVENERLRLEKERLRETQQRISSAAPNRNQK